jgi:hypothetical protein
MVVKMCVFTKGIDGSKSAERSQVVKVVKAVSYVEVSARRICVYPVLALSCEEPFVTLLTANQTPAREIDWEPLSP